MDTRQQQLQTWLQHQANLLHFQMEPIPSDASFRRYFRIKTAETTFVAMDAPPTRENCKPYVLIAKALREIGLKTPEILEGDLEQGFLLVTDFGQALMLNELGPANADQLYNEALNSLAVLQGCQKVEGWPVPLFTADFMRNELELFKEWFLQKHLNLQLTQEVNNKLSTCFDFLAAAAAQQTQVFMHRDYHSANLMVLPSQQIGILDFQDAFVGPITYDLVSLLRDCYIDWPDEQVTQWVLNYKNKITIKNVSADEFLRWFDLMGIQRHMKALLTFSRKFHRDNNPSYLKHIPRTLNYIKRISARYPECLFLHDFISERVNACAE